MDNTMLGPALLFFLFIGVKLFEHVCGFLWVWFLYNSVFEFLCESHLMFFGFFKVIFFVYDDFRAISTLISHVWFLCDFFLNNSFVYRCCTSEPICYSWNICMPLFEHKCGLIWEWFFCGFLWAYHLSLVIVSNT